MKSSCGAGLKLALEANLNEVIVKRKAKKITGSTNRV